MANLYQSARVRPNVVARAVLRRYFRDVHSMANPEEVSLAELEQFFNDYGWHFTKEDVQEFLYEARYLLDEDSNLRISETADYVRDQVHGFPQ